MTNWKWFFILQSKFFPKMTLQEFEKTDLHSKIRIILNQGEYIEEFCRTNAIVSLYSLNLFFVEVITTDTIPTKVLEINGFDDGTKLNKYTLSRSLNK